MSKIADASDGEVSKNPKCAYEEFQLFYESAEKVTDRRLETNRWNYSICTAISVIGVALSWAMTNPNFLVVAVVGAFLLSMMAILFCSLWILQIQDFKQLNKAKFSVLNNMAPNIKFSESSSDDRASFDPFSKEWDDLKRAKAVREMYSTNIIALQSSNIEYAIPQAFRLLFIAISIMVLIGRIPEKTELVDSVEFTPYMLT